MPTKNWKHVLTPNEFEELAERYMLATHFGAALVSGNRVEINRCIYYPWYRAQERNLDLSQMVQEALRWGRKKLRVVVFPKGTPVIPKNPPPLR